MDTLYTFWDNITHYKTESVDFWGLMNSATKIGCIGSMGLCGFNNRIAGLTRFLNGCRHKP